MTVVTERYVRKPLYVEAVRVTEQNFDELVTWCEGEAMYDEVDGVTRDDKPYIKVDVHNPKNARQAKAFVGDWLLRTDKGLKVYTHKAFVWAFEKVKIAPATESRHDVSLPPIQHIYRDAGTGQLVTREYAEANPDTTVREAIEVDAPTPMPETDGLQGSGEQETAERASRDTEELKAVVKEEVAEGKTVLSLEEQAELGPDGVRDLLQSGEAVLAQDLV